MLLARDDKRVWALALSPDDGGESQWVHLTWNPPGVGATWDPPRRGMTFDEWVDASRAEQRGEEVQPALLLDDRVVPAPGVRVLEAILHPQQAAAFGPVRRQAAALLQLSDGTRVYALVTGWGTHVVDPAVLPEDTLGGFLAYVEARGAAGKDRR